MISLEFEMENEIIIHSEIDLRSKIYTIRGIQVMLDFDLAEIYGYSVKAFNQQVKNNIEKFDSDFRFQLKTAVHGKSSPASAQTVPLRP